MEAHKIKFFRDLIGEIENRRPNAERKFNLCYTVKMENEMKTLKLFYNLKKSLLSLRGMKLSPKYLFTVAFGVAILFTTSAASSATLLIHSTISWSEREILAFDETTGAFLDTFIDGMYNRNTFLYGPDGHLYLTETGNNNVLRYNGTTGAFIDEFVPNGSGGLVTPTGMTFGPDGHLYVSSYNDGMIRRYNGTTGNFIDVFATTGSILEMGLVFNPTGTVLYAQSNTGDVFLFNGTTGEFIDTRSVGGSGDLAFGPDDNLYAVVQNGGVKRLDGDAYFIDWFVPDETMDWPIGMEFGPDGNLYVLAQDFAYRFDGSTGAGLGTLAPNTTGEFRMDLTFMPPIQEQMASIPTLPEWGMIIMSVLLFGAVIWTFRRSHTVM